MIRAINSLPLGWTIFAYIVLGWGLFVVLLFLARYVVKLPWTQTEEGKHLVAMSSSVGAFFLLYVIQAFVPNIPGRAYIMVVLLVALVVTCTWRWVILEKRLAVLRRAALRTEEGPA